MRCSPFQVIVCSGAQLALSSTARLLADPGDTAWVEDPGYSGARGAIAAAAVRLHPVPVDEDGLRVSDAVAGAPPARIAYVSPSHQYPLGVTMSVERRRALLEWAARERAWILEDDYDAEFRFGSQPLPALQNLDRDGTVIYIGTFSKVLFPGLRLGYLIVPESLVDTFVRAHAVLGYRPPMPEQAILAEYIEGGHFARHLRRMRQRYADARGTLVDAVQRQLAGRLTIRGANVGLHVVGELPAGSDDADVSRRAAFLGVSAPPLSAYYTLPVSYPGLVLGYGHLDPHAIKAGVERLVLAIAERAGRGGRR